MNRVGQPSVADDGTIEGWSRLAAVFHGNSSKAVMQINHAGGASSAAITLAVRLQSPMRNETGQTRLPCLTCDVVGSGGRIRTDDLRVMSPTSYQTAPPRNTHLSRAL
jgi:2,4-dienoyl-CoA reductase-like NADH-dependent reductase (Old Yellow Enzyme family)